MTLRRIRLLLLQNWPFYVAGAAALAILKASFGHAAPGRLRWLLAPTAWWVRAISGIAFEYDPLLGYVNHPLRFIIAPSCSGVQFLGIAMAMILFSYVHTMRTARMKAGWALSSLGISYVSTILANGLRILLSIRLPAFLGGSSLPALYGGWLTPGRLHTMTGVAVYFTSLLLLYHWAGYIAGRAAGGKAGGAGLSAPVFWYFSIVLGIPFLNQAYRGNERQFTEFALVLTITCLAVLLLFFLAGRIRKYWERRTGP